LKLAIINNQHKERSKEMNQNKSLITAVLALWIIVVLAGLVSANVPAPPVNQSIGFDDTIFNNLEEADCRVCHDDPAVTGPTPNVDRHHLLYGSPLPEGECSVNSTACLSDGDCDPGLCSRSPAETCTIGECDSSGDPCQILADCPPGNTACSGDPCDEAGLGETCGEVCIGETVAPDLDANGDGVEDTVYSCLSCHEQVDNGGIISFLVERDCLACHIQIPGEASVHHLLPVAQGTDSPIGDPDVGDCTPCHGTVVDDIGDGHIIPSYNPSLVTPAPSEDPAAPGGCNYCHDAGTDTISGVVVYTNEDNHHNTGVFRNEVGETNQNACNWCHDVFLPEEFAIRVCEGCHGYESLHNIQADSDGDCCVTVGEELPGYGHVGADDPGVASDCWGCHGFSVAAAPGGGPTVPFIASSDLLSIVAGTDTQVTLVGTGFYNTYGAYEWVSDILLTASDGSSSVLSPDSVDSCACMVTIPGTTAPGNYTLQAIKNDGTIVSNPVSLSVKPAVAITEVTCSKCLSTMTITGVSFSERPDGTDEDMSVTEGSRPLNIISWTDTSIEVSGARCAGTVSVNTLYGSATLEQ
jgi:hypothetical protein